ncbi:MAG: helix-turn-helix domain-containing protein [Synergistaceae bacterium]|jgi:hypothetical protein|nr:helix-turn-helix domain-containing protein [Synergistaceae bacterium]
MPTTVVTPDALELMVQLNATEKDLLGIVKTLCEVLEELKVSTVKPALMTTKEAAEYTKIGESTLAAYRTTGVIGDRTPAPAFIKVGGSVFYEKSELDRWIKEDLPHFKHTRPKKEVV